MAHNSCGARALPPHYQETPRIQRQSFWRHTQRVESSEMAPPSVIEKSELPANWTKVLICLNYLSFQADLLACGIELGASALFEGADRIYIKERKPMNITYEIPYLKKLLKMAWT
jgi:hypothetical protein